MSDEDVLSVDTAALSHDGRLAALEQVQLLRARLDAVEQELLAAVAGSDPSPRQWVREEVAVVLRLAPQTAASRLAAACILVNRLPETLVAVRRGRIGLAHAKALVDAVVPLDDDAAARVEQRVLQRGQGQTVPQFRAACRRAALAVDPRAAQERHDAAVTQRTVTFAPEQDGMAALSAFLPAADIARIRQRVEACARSVDDPNRTAAQRRADAFTDLLLSGTVGDEHPPTRPILVMASMSTLRGRSDQPGELDGEPVTAAVVRALANDREAWWRPVLVDDGDGGFVAAGAHTYRPSAALQRHIRLRDRTCRFPGCRRPAEACEVDHITAWADGGLTTENNLHCLCKRHHRLKHSDAGWWVTRRARDGATVWHTPTGRWYEALPEPCPVGPDDHVVGHDPPPF